MACLKPNQRLNCPIDENELMKQVYSRPTPIRYKDEHVWMNRSPRELKKKSLQSLATYLQIRGRSKLKTKDELIKALEDEIKN